MRTDGHSVGREDHENDGERQAAPQTDEEENEEDRPEDFANGTEEREKRKWGGRRMPPRVGPGGVVGQNIVMVSQRVVILEIHFHASNP